MAANGYIQGQSVSGLGTFKVGSPGPGTYNVTGTLVLPSFQEGNTGDSAVVVTVSLNGGSTLFTSLPGAQGFSTQVTSTSSSDQFYITLSSSAPVDQGLNIIRTTISVY